MTRKGWLLFIAISVFWGIPYFFIKIVVRELDPIIVVFARIGIAALVLVPVALQHNLLYPLRKRWGAIFMLSLVQIVGPFLLISYGEQHISSSLTSLLIAAEPLIVALLAWRFDPSEQVDGVRLVGLIIGMIGVITLLGFDISGDAQRFLGAGFVLLAAAGYAAGALLMKRPAISSLPPLVQYPQSGPQNAESSVRSPDSLQPQRVYPTTPKMSSGFALGVVAFECAIATLLLFPLALTRLPSRLPPFPVIASLLVLGLICTASAYLILFALIAEVGASRGTVFTYVNPVVSVLLGVTLLGEQLNIITIVGFLLIIAGSWFSTGGGLPVSLRGWFQRHEAG